MKLELNQCPSTLKEEYGFSFMEHVLAIPSPLVTVTTYKANGLPNACMQSWCTFVGENGYLYNIHSPQNPITGEETQTYVGTLNKYSTYDDLAKIK